MLADLNIQNTIGPVIGWIFRNLFWLSFYTVLVMLALVAIVLVIKGVLIILSPGIAVCLLAISIATAPITILLRRFGYTNTPFLGSIFWRYFSRWLESHAGGSNSQSFEDELDPEEEFYRRQQEAEKKRRYREDSESAYQRQQEREQSFDPYEVLGVKKSATKREILLAYKDKMMKNHPDKTVTLDRVFQELAHEQAIKIQKAYSLLSATG